MGQRSSGAGARAPKSLHSGRHAAGMADRPSIAGTGGYHQGARSKIGGLRSSGVDEEGTSAPVHAYRVPLPVARSRPLLAME